MDKLVDNLVIMELIFVSLLVVNLFTFYVFWDYASRQDKDWRVIAVSILAYVATMSLLVDAKDNISNALGVPALAISIPAFFAYVLIVFYLRKKHAKNKESIG